MNRKTTGLVHLLIPLFALHLWEEIKTGFYLTDPSIHAFSQYLNITSDITFYLIELVLFIFLGILLCLVLAKKQIPHFLLIVLTIISLFEFTHVYEAIKTGAYVPGLITGSIIALLGVVLLFLLSQNKRH